MTTVKTASGKEFASDYFVYHKPSKSIFLRIMGADIQTIREVFGNPTETNTLLYKGKQYQGFTQLEEVIDEDQAWKLRLCSG